MKKILFFLFATLANVALLAQQDLSTHFMRHTWQAHRTNPALYPDYGVSIGLPGVYNSLWIENLTYNTLFTTDANGQQVIDINSSIAALEGQNRIREQLDLETLSLGLRLGPVGLSFAHAFRFNAYLDYPKALPQLIWQGNAQFIGQEVSFGPQTDIYAYQEFAVGAMVDLAKWVQVGGRVKFLSGAGSVSTANSGLRLRTDDEIYALTLDADFRLNTAASINYNGFDDVRANFDFASFSLDQLTTGNNGFAFDIGARIDLGKLDLSASLLDIGQITWDEDVSNYSLNGVYEYEGLDLAQGIFEDSTSFGSVLDTLKQIYEVKETQESYEMALPRRMYLSATLQLRENWTVGGLFYSERYRGQTFTAAALSTNLQVLSMLNVGALFAYRDRRFDNLGLNATFKLGPVQLMSATDNILTVFQPKDSNSSSLRIGLNLLFNRIDPPATDAGPKWF